MTSIFYANVIPTPLDLHGQMSSWNRELNRKSKQAHRYAHEIHIYITTLEQTSYLFVMLSDVCIYF